MPGESMDGLLRGENIVCIAPGYWDESWLDMHRYMQLLATDNRVLVVERPVTPLSFITPGQKQHALPQLKRWLKQEIRQIAPNLYVGVPPPVLPLRFETPMLEFNQIIRRAWLRKQIQNLGMATPVLWIYDPDAEPLIGHLDEKCALYMVTDDYATMPVFFNRPSQIRKWDTRLTRAVDLVVATEAHLAEHKRVDNPHTTYVPHGVDYEIFVQALDPATEIAPELRYISSPIIGFIGRINQRIDLELIAALCTQQSEWLLVFVGSLDDDAAARRLAHSPQIRIIPVQPVAQLPKYLKAMSVCIIPYVLNEYTQHSHPLKALEYLAAGKPVVSTPLPALLMHAPHITFAASRDTFIDAIASTLATDTPELQRRRSIYTQDKTWSHQLHKICQHIRSKMR
jgi:glycosyltransferase involved in cell wall biosynthesis